MRARSAKLALAAVLAWAGTAWAQAPLAVTRVSGAGPIADPSAPAWKLVRPVKVAMLPQTVTLPNHPEPAIKELAVRAVHNGGWIAFLIEWKDSTLSDRVVLDNFGDQVASSCRSTSRRIRRRP
jgi:DMSO reductase family type II enzyme heme b subunit